MRARVRSVDAAAFAVCSALVVVLGWKALQGIPPPAVPPTGFDGWLSQYTETVILVWCALTVLYAPGFLRPKRSALVAGLAVNAVYLAASLPGLHAFAIAMHAILAGYCGWRLSAPTP